MFLDFLGHHMRKMRAANVCKKNLILSKTTEVSVVCTRYAIEKKGGSFSSKTIQKNLILLMCDFIFNLSFCIIVLYVYFALNTY